MKATSRTLSSALVKGIEVTQTEYTDASGAVAYFVTAVRDPARERKVLVSEAYISTSPFERSGAAYDALVVFLDQVGGVY